MASTETRLVKPLLEHLPSYVEALKQGWSADTVRGPLAAREELATIEHDAQAFIDSMDDREAKGAPVTLPDGSTVARLPGLRRWMWAADGFAGSVGLRWVNGTTDLPPFCLGHIGYAVLPWKQRRGHATAALAAILPIAKAEGLPFVIVTADATNAASHKVIQANGGVLVERFVKEARLGGGETFRFKIDIA